MKKGSDISSAALLLILFFILIGTIAHAEHISYRAAVVAPDPSISSDNILFSPENPVEGQPVNITAVIHNIGGYTASNVTVDFYINSINVMRKEMRELPAYSKKVFQLTLFSFIQGRITSL